MSSAAIATVVKMMEFLSVEVQDRVAEHLREYIETNFSKERNKSL
ncbi:hypothetical protein [Nostoc mirabile]|nr:hypothetical protein [Nostoc mirabile]